MLNAISETHSSGVAGLRSFAAAVCTCLTMVVPFSAPTTAQGASGLAPADSFRDNTEFEGREPERGGQVVVHIEAMPAHLNRVMENSAVSYAILDELHESLLRMDPGSWDLVGGLAEAWQVQDMLVLEETAAGGNVIGEVLEQDAEGVLIRLPASNSEEPAGASRERRVPHDSIERVLLGSVFTFQLRQGVRWHDGHLFDAHDVAFSIECYRNPAVQAEAWRHLVEGYEDVQVLDSGRALRVVVPEPTFLTEMEFGDLCILPAHIYNLRDPDHPNHKADATDAEVGAAINSHPANMQWVGLGAYRLVQWRDSVLVAERFPDYFDPVRAGYVDRIVWRAITDAAAAREALISGEVDWCARLGSREYFGEYTKQDVFRENFDKGLYYTPQMSFISWNMRRPMFQDVRVRTALAHALDLEAFIKNIAGGVGKRVTASWYHMSPDYDRDLAALPFDLKRARKLLFEAGWYDRDDDGLIDREGQAFRFELMHAQGDVVGMLLGQLLQESLAELGIEMTLVAREWAAYNNRVGERDYDAAHQAWLLGPVTNPRPFWHSDQAQAARTYNLPGLEDEVVDELIAAIEVEFDRNRRSSLFHQLQARIYQLQPYLFGVVFPNKFAVSKRVRGVQPLPVYPGYSIRQWWVVQD